MPRFLDIEVLGVQRVERQLLRGAERAGNMRPALVLIREDIWATIRENFETEGTHSGTAWTPISEDWLQRKIAKGWSEGILIAKGRLYDAFTGRSRWTRSNVYHDRVVIDSNLPYANVMQYGNSDQGIPARPFVRWRPKDVQRWSRMATASLIEAMR